eukprot:12736916-Heterocapsa_arctica.AAC.1
MGIDEFFDESGSIRPCGGCFVGDSGALGYCGLGKKPASRGLKGMLQHPAECLKHKWGSATMESHSGWTAKEMVVTVRAYIHANTHKMTPDGSGK